MYKLAAIENDKGEFIPKIKLSENTEKVTNPGNKTVYRIYDKETGKIRADLICLVGETFDPEQDMKLSTPMSPGRRPPSRRQLHYAGTSDPGNQRRKTGLRLPRRHGNPGICTKEKETLWDENKRFVNPSKVYVDLSKKLYDMKNDLLNQMSM